MKNNLLRNSNLYLIFSITLFAVMGVTSIAPAFPQIINHYSLSGKQIGYLITFFTLPGIFLTPFTGILADRYGRKTILVPSMILFGLAGFLCAFMPDYPLLLVMRFIQGLGAASLGSLNITIIGDLFEGNTRVRAMGYNASVLSIGTASFPAIGGLIATIDWKYVFFLPIIILPLAFLVLFKLRTPAIKNEINLKTYLSNVWKTINRKKVWGLFIVNIMVFIILYGALISYFPLLMKKRFEANSFIIGITMSLMSLTTAICASQLGKLRKTKQAHSLMIFSASVYAMGLLIISFAFHWPVVILAVIFFGVGHGFFIPNIQTVLVGLAPITERAAFMSLNSMVLRIGQTLGPLIIGFFYLPQNLKPVFWAAASVALLMIVILLAVIGNIESDN